MKRLQFSININANKATIWKVLWDDASYRDWTSEFIAGSHAVTEGWKEGSKVWFLSPDQHGIYSIIEKHMPNETMSFKHIGNVKDGQEQALDDETKKWSGSMEIYRLAIDREGCVLTVEIDTQDDYVDSVTKVFQKALERVRVLSEDMEV